MIDNKYSLMINELVSKVVEKGEYAGVSCCVLKDGKEYFKGAWGMADIERGITMQTNSIFRAHSLSKVITSVAVMKLFEQGKLDLNYCASWYLDGFKNQQVLTDNGLVPANRDVTIKDLLNMTSGCVYPDGDDAGQKMGEVFWKAEQAHNEGNPIDTIEMANRIGKSPLCCQPGEKWHYGTSADILGAIVEIITKKKYDDFLREEIFEPLGMNDTGFYVPDDKKNRFTQLYDYPQGKPVPFQGSFLGLYNYDSRPAFISGGAGVVTTAEDYAKFAAMLANGGEYNGVRILSKKTVEFMATDNLTEEQKVEYRTWVSCYGYGYGNLCRVLTDKTVASTLAPLGEFGWDGWAGAYASINRDDNLAFTLFVQRCGAGTTDIARRVKNIILSSL